MRAFSTDPSQTAPAKTRMEQRTSVEAKQLIERAAHALGISPSEFVVAAACREARTTLRQAEVTYVSPHDADAFVAAFEADEPTLALIDLMRLPDAGGRPKAR